MNVAAKNIKRKKKRIERFQMAVRVADIHENYCENCEIALAMRMMTNDKNSVKWCRSKCSYGKEMTAIGKKLAPQEMNGTCGRPKKNEEILEKYQYWMDHKKPYSQAQIASFMGIGLGTLQKYRREWRAQGLIKE